MMKLDEHIHRTVLADNAGKGPGCRAALDRPKTHDLQALIIFSDGFYFMFASRLGINANYWQALR
jgi:hypothetical protein